MLSSPRSCLCVHVLETATALDSQDFYLCSHSEGEAFCLSLLEVLSCLPRSWEGRRSEELWSCRLGQLLVVPWKAALGVPQRLFLGASAGGRIRGQAGHATKGCASSLPHCKQSRSQISSSLSTAFQNRVVANLHQSKSSTSWGFS